MWKCNFRQAEHHIKYIHTHTHTIPVQKYETVNSGKQTTHVKLDNVVDQIAWNRSIVYMVYNHLLTTQKHLLEILQVASSFYRISDTEL